MDAIRRFFQRETAGGYVLIAASLLGFVWANSPFASAYEQLLHAKFGVVSDVYTVKLTTHDWVNDALMTVFFFLIGLEIKYELLRGRLSSVQKAVLPLVAAIGGMVCPALICAAFVSGDPSRVDAWAIPVATDIAFVLAAFGLLGNAVPPALKIYLVALAVIDDLGAILIIAIFYTPNLVVPALLAAAVGVALLIVFNRLRVLPIWPYLLVGVVVWFCVFESGVHATLAGVAVALTIPIDSVKELEHALRPYVEFVILPVFGLFNAGVSLAGLTPAVLLGPLPIGIALGLFFGKQLGIFGASWLAIRLGKIAKPEGVTWAMIYGVALLGGIGFTMSLFIGTLAFSSDLLLTETKIGVFAGSALSAVFGYLVLRRASRLSA